MDKDTNTILKILLIMLCVIIGIPLVLFVIISVFFGSAFLGLFGFLFSL